MKILITNDDGVNSSGILAARKAVENLGETIIVAPATQQSGIGHALTLFEPIRVSEVTLRDGSEAYAVSGTPTDAVIIGIFELMDEKPDLVISGINMGENLGKSELTTSGTIGAAMEAAVHGVPSLAVSLQVRRGDIKFHDGHVDVDFSLASELTERVASRILRKGLPDGVDFLNLNIPSHPSGNDIRITRLGDRMYNVHIKKRLDPRGRPYYWIDGDPAGRDAPGTDVHTLKAENTATLTPVSLDCTAPLDSMREWLD
ncbi:MULTISPECIES: 5'/3'-nucleotidase SurE [Methanothermobacter]|uniref:5'-nucleotidase SurE n=1 Tax=Methanothermobacter marburgensis (strain ATCC BAA-927 / DSM 2133 / JCM 14651 / NBRC 100331 / OCM 82 / Marburg) TaxID=79929 RepID=D9PYT7_METTM|nr:MULTISPECIES: 5'/3'-nucleotidase SurE [Methanothermobacter]ADL57632.1 predicted phosphatase [Methanothermobacter marburgensis str. Marburg]QEF94466.1 5'/3'-nucleotidase SurE [Methanothermobacter sp. KEPCO-1]QHN07613.1 5'/3'-nucleotidase SurE [Methanothermobacter sp. THM-2]WBF09867.1 5'/3'-nucleotidase SurE [Methanothermobacter marburgensis]